MYREVTAAVLSGINSFTVNVEADVGNGMPVFELVGFLSSEVREARERIRSAAQNSGLPLPPKHITVNISPADKKKHGTGLDLAIAVAVITAGIENTPDMTGYLIVGELGLNGDVRPINGILSMVIAARETGKHICIVPCDNYREALLVPDIKAIPVRSLNEALDYLIKGKTPDILPESSVSTVAVAKEGESDFKYINGQKFLRRACEVAVAGRHNLLMVGPPGAGKSMIAKCIPTILPKMSTSEKLEVSKIYSACGLFGERESLIENRPFRAPHHTISAAGLCGGGTVPHPGEISLAHAGVLFLDELTEFSRQTIEILRQPLEERQIHISRVNGDCEFPADFMLVAAMNPCPCGNFPDLKKCRCTGAEIERYQGKLSQPLLDRIDMCVEAPRIGFLELTGREENESSDEIRKRIERISALQKERYKKTSYKYNSRIPASDMDKYCRLGQKEHKYVTELYERLGLTARTYHKLLRVARTIADMDGCSEIGLSHLNEAVCYRGIEDSYREVVA
ncbi:MAG: YifB family Mg chelatase-like AAA ATPase [Lachnospiraceae bacterium]|nr:YifB family Mg chelatase-like AAA ATPase [Lachnospiraceae bacterium]